MMILHKARRCGVAASKEKSLAFLARYFKDTPSEGILKDMRKYWPEESPIHTQRKNLWLRVRRVVPRLRSSLGEFLG
ncbi:MAG: hypothetical protein Q8R28_13545 [Dehalococcoidia bacterium]|nr:hypothetical protein [Dehalococcoidia bacterium]